MAEALSGLLQVERPPLLLLLLVLPLLFLIWWRFPPALTRGRSRAAAAVRLAVVLLLVLALAGVEGKLPPQHRALIAVVDLSGSERGALASETSAVRSLMASKGADDLFGIVTFGRNATVELPPTRTPVFSGFQTRPDAAHTDIAGAFRLAGGLVPAGYAGQLVLVSDGRQNLGDADGAAAALRAQAVRVDVYPPAVEARRDALIAAVEAPPDLLPAQSVAVTVRLRSTFEGSASLVLQVDDGEPVVRKVVLRPGTTAEAFQVGGLSEGWHRLRARLEADGDEVKENNVAEAALHVRGSPRVLVLEGPAADARNVVSALQAGGSRVDRLPAAQAPADPAGVAVYDAVVVVDVPADAFPPGALDALAGSVRDLGHGLVAIGGPNSYGAGGWQNTPLESALPVLMQAKQRKQQTKAAVVLALESVEDRRGDQIALGAAQSVVESMRPEDELAVVDLENHVLLPLTPVRQRKQITDALADVELGDPDLYQPALETAGHLLEASDAGNRQIVLVADGDADDSANPQPDTALVQHLRAGGITTSAIALDLDNEPAYMGFMEEVARAGGGRYHRTTDPSKLPRLFFDETQEVARPRYEQETFVPTVGSPGEILTGLTGGFPQLDGYVVATAKPSAQVYLKSPQEDPVLATWRYGFGRAVAWTSDSRGQWTSNFLKSPVSGALFARMVAWTLPEAGPQQLRAQARLNADGIDVEVRGPTSGGDVDVGVAAPDGHDSRLRLRKSGAGVWQGHLAADSEGTYHLHAVLSGAGRSQEADVAIAVPYSPEYLVQGPDEPSLSRLAQSGTRLHDPPQAWALPISEAPLAAQLSWLLLLLAVVLWPLDVALRRLAMSPAELARAVARRLKRS